MSANFTTNKRRYLLIFGDIFVLYFSLFITLIIRYQGSFNLSLWSRHFIPFTIVFVLWLITFYIDDLYEISHRQERVGLLSKILIGSIIGVLLAFAFFYIGQDKLFTIKPQRVLLIQAGISALLIYVWHLAFFSFTKSEKIGHGMMIVGYNKVADEIIKKIKNKPQFGFSLKTIIVSPQDYDKVPDELKNIAIRGNYDELKFTCLNQNIDTIVSTINPRDSRDLQKSLFECLSLKIDFFDTATFYEQITGKIPVDTIEEIWFLENLTEGNKRFYEKIKRVFDVLFSLILLILLLPFTPLIAALIKITSKGPILFKQIRTGKDGKPFDAMKFRTMVQDAEKNGPQWATKNDARVTPIGKIFRKTRIDEIPQLINIIKGEMSLIGPRPERPEFIEKLETEIPFYKQRLLVKPGLSGWAQVVGPSYGGSKEETLEKLQYDLYYVKNRSISLDLSIVLKTIKTVLSVKGQ